MTDLSSSTRGPWLIPLAIGIVGMLLAFYPTLLSGFDELQVGPGDPRLVNYQLEHTYLWASGRPGHESFWSPPVFHPVEGISAYSDTVLGAAPLYWLWRVFGFEGGVALQLWVMTCFCLNFGLAYLFLARCLGFGQAAAAFGAFFFGFGITRLSNFNSPQLFPVFYSVLAFIAAHRVLVPGAGSRGAVWVLVFFASLALQAWSAYYPAFFLAAILGVAVLAALVRSEDRKRLFDALRRHAIVVPVGVVLLVCALVPLASAHLGAASEVGWRDYSVVERGLPGWSSWIFPGIHNRVYGGLASLEAFDFTLPSQHTNGLGIVTSIVCLLGLYRHRKRPVVRIAFVTTLVLVLLTTRVGDFSLWRFAFDWVPGARAVRYVARFGMFLVVPAMIGCGLLLEDLLSRRKQLLALSLALVCVVEQAHALSGFDEGEYRELIDRVAAEVGPDCEAFFLSTHEIWNTDRGLPPLRLTHVLAMWVGVRTGRPTINGFYGNSPPDWTLARVDVRERGGRKRLERELERWLAAHGLDPSSVCRVELPAPALPWSPR